MDWVFFIGVFAGAFMSVLLQRILTTHGTLRIDHSNPEKDIYRFEIDKLDGLNGRLYIKLRIDHHANLRENNESFYGTY